MPQEVPARVARCSKKCFRNPKDATIQNDLDDDEELMREGLAEATA